MLVRIVVLKFFQINELPTHCRQIRRPRTVNYIKIGVGIMKGQ
jgi:hypothetical protein